MTRVLLTGASGYIGRPVHDALLARGYDVHAVSRADKRHDDTTTWHSVDLLDSAAMDALLEDISATHLIHLAWITEPGAYWQSDANQLWQKAGIHMLRTFESQGGKRAVLAGTCAEYDLSDGHCVAGETPLRTLSAYTEAKSNFRQAANTLAVDTHLQVSWARVFFSFGPNEHPQRLVSDVVLALLNGERAACSDGEQVRDFMYVNDMAAALVTVLESKHRGDINIASGEAMSIKELVTLVARRLDAVERVDFGARERQAGEAANITADVSQLRDIGWSSEQSIESAIDETIAWWKQQGNIK